MDIRFFMPACELTALGIGGAYRVPVIGRTQLDVLFDLDRPGGVSVHEGMMRVAKDLFSDPVVFDAHEACTVLHHCS